MSHGDSVPVDLLMIAPWANLEKGLTVFQHVVASDTMGCMDLCCPEKAVPLMALEDSKVPVLLLVRALVDADWKPHKGKVLHKPSDRAVARNFSPIDINRKRSYLQCLLRLDSMFAFGL